MHELLEGLQTLYLYTALSKVGLFSILFFVLSIIAIPGTSYTSPQRILFLVAFYFSPLVFFGYALYLSDTMQFPLLVQLSTVVLFGAAGIFSILMLRVVDKKPA